jgi:uncharacterized coiled-coil protein SlyX
VSQPTPSSPPSIEARLVELESRYCALEHLVEKLDLVVREQADLIEENQRRLKLLREELRRAEKPPEGEEPPPPHY